MADMKVTIRVEIELTGGGTTTVEQTVRPRGYGDNPVFLGDVFEQASLVARTRVRDAIEAVHGKAPEPARYVTVA